MQIRAIAATLVSDSGADKHGTVAFLEVDRVAQSDAADDGYGLHDWSPLEFAASQLMADLTSEAERVESGSAILSRIGPPGRNPLMLLAEQRFERKLKTLLSALSSLLAAASAVADVTDEHRSYDSSGENGSEITKACTAVLKACGISRSAYWKNTLVGKHCLRLLEKIEFVLAAMVAVMRKMSIPPGVGSESRKAEREKAIEEVQEDLQAPPSGALVVRPVDAEGIDARSRGEKQRLKVARLDSALSCGSPSQVR
jgi:hypothetical protein